MIERFRNKGFIQKASALMKWVTLLTMIFLIVALILSLLGRVTFSLHTPQGTWERAIYAEESHDFMSRSITATSKDDIHVISRTAEVPHSVQITISLMVALDMIPVIVAMYFLSSVFDNVSKGKIFIEANSRGLFLYGAINFIASLLSPFIKLGICSIANHFMEARIDISTGSHMIEELIPAIGFIIASYIIKHGLELQNEVDHTI